LHCAWIICRCNEYFHAIGRRPLGLLPE
jgi:hypothetical protein